MAKDRSQDEKLFKSLSLEHPDYVTFSEEWTRCRDVLGHFYTNKETYLPRNRFEPKDQYDFRVEMSEFIPESGLAIGSLIGALYGNPPRRELKPHEAETNPFLDNADRRGSLWGDYVERVCAWLLGYGVLRLLVNVPKLSESGSRMSRAEEQAGRIQPFCVLYTPLETIDWDVDDYGEPNFMMIRELRYVPNPRRGEKHVKSTKFVRYDRDKVQWWRFEETDNERYSLRDKGESEHGLGVVPIVTEAFDEIRPLIGSPYIRYSAKADIQKFRAESDLGYDTYLHAHPILKIWSADEVGDIGLGSSSFLKLNPNPAQREDADYLKAPDSAFDALREVVKDKRTQIYRHANTDPLGVIESGSTVFQASGVARAWSFSTSEARMLKKIARRMERVEKKVLDLVVRYQTKGALPGPDKPVFRGDVQYPEEFDLSSTSQLLDEEERIAQRINSPTLLRIVQKRIAAAKLGNAPTKEIEEVKKEIENNPLINTSVGRAETSPFGMPGILPGGGVEEDELEDNGKEGRTAGDMEGGGSAVRGGGSKTRAVIEETRRNTRARKRVVRQ